MQLKTKVLQNKVVQSFSNGVFGEFLQGVRSDNRAFLITSPVDIYSIADFTFDSNSKYIRISDPTKFKAQLLANKLYDKFNLTEGGIMNVQTQFPIGKGLGSSSADLVAIARTLSHAYSLNLTPQAIEELIRGIEPTDGVMYPGIVSYFYKDVQLNKPLGYIEGAMILGVDEGGEVDTLEYNKVKRDYSAEEKRIYDKLHNDLEIAVKNNDISSLGKVSTQSGLLNQRFNCKKLFNDFLKISNDLHLPGVVVAHSGTYLGFLLDKTKSYFPQIVEELKKMIGYFGHNCEIFHCRGNLLE